MVPKPWLWSFVGLLAIVQGKREPLVLDRPCAGDLVPETRDGQRGFRCVRMQLESVVADVTDPLDTHEVACLGSGASADAGHKPVPRDEPAKLVTRRLGNAGELRPGNDRGERAVDVE